MKAIELPVLDFESSKEVIKANRKKIDDFQAILKAALRAAEGLHETNRALCDHKNKEAEYDPGYAGGGFSNYYCPTCGSSRC